MKNKKVRGSHRLWWLGRTNDRKLRDVIRKAGRSRYRIQTGQNAREVVPQTSVIAMPKSMIVERDEQRAILRRSLDTAFEALGNGRRVKFDFSPVLKIFPGGLLVFLAHLELMILTWPGKVSIRTPHGSMAAQLLDHFGISALIGKTPSSIPSKHESVVNWRYLTGHGSEGEKILELLNSYKAHSDAEIPEGLYDVLAEAFTNVRHHAFPAGRQIFDELKRWWLFSRYEAPKEGKRGNLYIAIYDIGVGIQNSMRSQLKTGEWVLDVQDEILSMLSSQHSPRLERVLLKRAVEHERSSTGLKNRGLGLPEMKEFVMSTQGGRLYILSGEAQYSCIQESGAGEVFECFNGFPGTLILWSLPLMQKETT